MTDTAATIRVAGADDAAAIAAIYAPYVRETAISFETEPPDAEEMLRRMLTGLRDCPWLVCEAGGEVAGYAYASPHRARAGYRWSVDVTVYLRQGLHRRGLGRSLYRPLLEILRRQGFVRAYAGIALPNAASVGLHEALGFSLIGVYAGVGHKLGAWRDVGWWGLALAAPSDPPAEPRPFDLETGASVSRLAGCAGIGDQPEPPGLAR